jgi:hypothetical protein
MKTKNLLKLALTMVAMFVMTSAMAQTYPAAIETDYENIAETVYQTAGKTFRLYVAPDPVFSPDYDGTDPADINGLSTWRWVTGASYAAGVEVKAWSAQNYVEVVNPSAGSLTYWVSERYNAACNDATGKSKAVTVVAAPTMQISTADPASACGNQPAATVALAITENVPFALARYAYSVTETVDTWDDINGTGSANVSTNATFVNATTGAKITPSGGDTQPDYVHGFTTSALNLDVSGKITVYTYTLGRPSDLGAGAAGVVSAISEKSDYIGGTVLTHTFGAKTTWQAIIVPTPTTGPIYHIPNDYAI